MRGPVRGGAGLEPAIQTGEKILVIEILTPKRGITHAGLGERAIEVQHADKAGPRAGPVGDGENRRLVRDEPGQQMVRILPDRLGDDERRLRIERGKHLHAFLLGADEAVFQRRFVGMGADEPAAETGDGCGELLFHGRLGGPARFIGRRAQIAVGDEQDGFLRGGFHRGERFKG